MRLGSTVIGTGAYSTPFSSSNISSNEPKIIGIGKDLSTGAAGYVRTGLSGSSGSYVRVIEFKLNTGPSSSGTNYINFQVQLFQATKMVKIVYASSSNNPSSYQIGLGNASYNKFWHVNPTNHTATYSTTYTSDTYSTYPNPSDSYRYYWFAPPHFTSTTTTYYISNFTTTGGNTNINNSSSGTGASWSNYYGSYSASYYAGSTVNFTITIAGGGIHGSAIWVDWNQNGMFESDERVYNTSSYTSSPHTGSFTIPASVAAGDYRMRIVSDYYGSNPNNPYEGNTGEFEDYKLTVTIPSTNYLPTNPYFKYSLTQQIYTPSEIAEFAGTSMSGNITSIQFYSGTSTDTRNLSIYMQNTSKSSFSSTTDWVTSSHNLVYQGDVTFAENSWVTIDLDTPFPYDASQNLLLVVDDNTGSYTSTRTFYTYPTGANRAMYVYSDGTNYSPTSSYSGTLLQYNNQLKLNIVPYPATLPYTENFDSDAHGFQFVNGSYANQWMVGNGVHSSGSQALYIANNGSYSYNNGSASYVYAYREINFAEAGDYNITFKWKGRGESSCYDAMYAALCPPSGTFPPSNITSYTNSLPSGYTNVGDVSQSYSTSGVFLWTYYEESGWRTSSKSINISSPGIYKLVFYWKNDGSGGNQPPAAVDDLTVTRAYPVTFAVSPSGSGTVSGTFNGTSVSSGTSFVPSSIINVTATPAAGYLFNGWTVSGTGASVANASAPSTTLTTGSAATTLTANFIPWTISVATSPSSTDCLTSGTQVTMTASTNIPQATLEQYTFATGTSSSKWYSVTNTTSLISAGAGDYGTSGVKSIGFTFTFAGTDYTDYSVNTDGYIRLGTTNIGTSYYSTPFGSNLSNDLPKIVAYGRDGYLTSEDYVYAQVFGSSPNRVLVIEIKTHPYDVNGTSNAAVKYQVQLHETTNEITFVYYSAPGTFSTTGNQIGIAKTSSDLITVNSSTHEATHRTSSYSTTNTASVWPGEYRYYSFISPAAITYAWTYSGTSGTANNNVYTASPTQNSTYTVSVTYNGSTKTETTNVTITPAAPTNLQYSAVTSTTATVSWSGSTGNYKYRVNSGSWTTTTSTSANLTGLTPGSSNTVQVVAVSGSCESDPASVTFTTLQRYTVSVTVSPSTTYGSVSGAGDYDAGSTVNLVATALSGYRFVNWTENGGTLGSSTTLTLTNLQANRNITANFEPDSFTITVQANPTAGGNVSGGGTYNYGAAATLSATPSTGYHFVNWTENGDEVSTNATYSFTVTGARDLVANFTPDTYTITATANPTAGGTVSGDGTYNYGAAATLSATPSTGYHFVNWTENGDEVSTNATYSFTVTGARDLVANFTPDTYTITATANPTAGGTITGAGTYNYDATATLTATANTGYHFVNWTENGSQVGTAGNTTYTISNIQANHDITANFERNTMTLTAEGDTWTYNGQAHTATVTPEVTAGTTLYYRITPNDQWSTNVPSIINVGTLHVYVKATNADYADSYADCMLEVTPKAVTITVTDAEKTYGAAEPTFTGSVEGLINNSDLGTITYYRTNEDENVGTYEDVITADYTPNSNYSVTVVPGDFTINQAKIDIVVTGNTSTDTYDTEEHSVSGYILACESDLFDAENVLFDGNDIAIGTNAGTYMMELDAEQFSYDDDNINATFTIAEDGKLTINQASITINVTGNTATETYNGEEQSVSGYELACESDLFNEENVAFSGNATATGTDAGEYPMGLIPGTFSYNDNNINATFTIAEDGKLTINPASITITVTGSTATETYNGEEQSVSGYELACTSDLFNEENVAFSGDATASGTDAGTYMMELAAEQFSYDDNNINATFSVTDGMLTITPASVTVNIVGNYNAEDYDGEEHTVSGYTISSIMMGEEETELYTEDDFTYSGDSMVSSTNAGTTYMGLSAEDFENTNENFDEVTFNIVSDGYITINPISAVVTITGRVDTVTYDGTEHTVTGYTATANTDLYDVEEDIEFSGEATASQTIVGTNYMGLTAEQFENTNENFEEVTFNIVTDGHITVNPVGVVVTIVGHTEEANYDGNAHTVNGYDVTSITIGNEPTQLYTANDFTFNGTASATRTNVVEGEDADGTTDMGLTPDMFTNTNTNFTDVTFNVTDGSITINPITATVNITGNYSSDAYDGEEHEVNGYEVTSIMIGEEETELYTTNDFTFTGTASASRTNVVEGEDADGTTNMGLTADMFANINTNFTDVTFNVTDGYQTITPITATVTIVGNHDIKDFDGEEHAVNDYEVTSIMVGEEETELYTEDDFTFSGTASAARTDAGTTNMNLTEGQFTNTNTNFSTVTFDITDGYITVNAVDAIVTIVGSVDTVTYDGTEHTVTHYTATANTDLYDVEEDFTFTPGETSTIVEDEIAATRTDVGTTYMGLTAEQFENTNENFANVTFNVTDGHITVNPAAITITADENGKVYGAAEPTTLTATVEGVPESGVDPVYTVSRAEGEDVGEYPITVTPSADANPNYTITTVGGVFTITPATVIVTADNKSKVYGTEDPDLTWTAEGFQYNDTEEVLTVSITRAEGNYVGDYTITPSGDAVQGNYNVEYVTGTFSILPTVVFTTDPMPTAICSEGSISVAFDATIAGENGAMTFAWSRNPTDDVTGTAEGTGNIEDLTLTTSATQTVTFSIIPTFTPTEGEAVTGDAVTFNVVVNALPAVTASHENVSCTELGSATLNVTNGDAPLSCLWNNSETVSLTADGNNYSVTFDELTEGDYTYAITNANNCVTEGTVSVSDPGRVTVSQSANSETCVNVGITVSYEIEGGTDPYTLTWMNADNDIPVEETEVNSTTGTHSFTLPEGEHRLALVITDHYGCSSTSDDIITVTVWPTQYIVRDIDLVGTQTTYVVNGITYDVNGEGPADQTYPDVHGCDSTIHYVINQYTLGISIADRCTMTQSSYTRTYSNTPHILYGDTIYVQKNNPATFYAYINDTQETQWNDEKMDMSYELLFNESVITDSDLPSLVSNFSISSYYDRTGQYYGMPNLTAATGEIPNNTLAFRQTANSTILHFDYFYFAAFKNIPNKVTLTGLENGTYTLKLKAELRHSTGGTNRTGIYNPYIVGRKYGHLWGGYNDRPGNREVIAARTFTIIVNETGTNPNGAPMAVNEYAEGASVMAFPNPVNDQLNLRISGMSGAAVITITDAQGKVVRTLNTELYGGEEVLTYSVADFAQGMYFINVRNSDTLVSEKFVVTRR